MVVQEKNPNREPVKMNQSTCIASVVDVEECCDLVITEAEESLNQHTAVQKDGYYGHESPGSGDQREETAVPSNLRYVAKSEMHKDVHEVRTRVVMKGEAQSISKATVNPRLKRIDAWYKKFKKRLLAVIPTTGNEAPMAA